MDTEQLLEPLAAYQNGFAHEFLQHAEEMFAKLLESSGIDAEENRATVKKYNAEMKKAAEAEKSIRKLKTVKGLLATLIALGVLLIAVGIPLLIYDYIAVGASLLPVGVLLVVVDAVVIPVVLAPRLKATEERRQRHEESADAYLSAAWKQMRPLNALFDDNMTKQLIEATVPLLKIDDNFNLRRYDYLSGKYGFGQDDNEDSSTIGILTGEILGNPFVVDRQLVKTMGTYTYTGSLVISWTTTRYDSEGHAHIEHHTQTLHASVTKPKPYFSPQTRLIYGNDAAPDLHFSRKPGHAETLSEKELERKVKKGAKKIRKKQARAAATPASNFTEMGNEEFDVLFGAFDRDNEVQFRLLFTPLAQKNLLALLKNTEEGYSDDFYMRKSGCLNYICSEHSAQWDPDTDRSQYYSYSVDLSHSAFIKFNTQYFRSLYFDFAPLLSIPLYQQMKPKEYLYREEYPRNLTRYETEYAVNRVGQQAFAPQGAATASILKTTFLSADGKSDRVRVTAHSYRTVDHVEYVSVWGGDDRMHEVPVKWVEYIPISDIKDVMLKELGLTGKQFAEEESIKGALQKHGGTAYGYGHGILCCVTDDDSEFDSDFSIINQSRR